MSNQELENFRKLGLYYHEKWADFIEKMGEYYYEKWAGVLKNGTCKNDK